MKHALASVSVIICFAACCQAAELNFFQQQAALTEASERYEVGRRLLARGEYTAAVAEFKRAQGMLERIRLYSGEEIEVFAQAACAGAHAQNPGVSCSVPASAASAPVERDETSRRKAAADQQYNRAVEMIEEGRFTQAEEALLKVLALCPGDRDALYNLGVLYENCLGDRAKALAYYVKYLEIDRKSETAWQVQEWVRELKGQHER